MNDFKGFWGGLFHVGLALTMMSLLAIGVMTVVHYIVHGGLL